MPGGSSNQNDSPDLCSLFVGLYPCLNELKSKEDTANLTNLKEMFIETERIVPGFTEELLKGVLQKESKQDVNYAKSLLKMASDSSTDLQIKSDQVEVQRLAAQANKLKEILSRIPDEIVNRPKFLQTIKDIAQAIKNLLSKVNESLKKCSVREYKKLCDQQKKQFVRDSKTFSDTLKQYFKDFNELNVYTSANKLISQANSLITVFDNSTTQHTSLKM